MKLLSLFLATVLYYGAYGQLSQSTFQAIDVNDAQRVEVELGNFITTEFWDGDKVLIEALISTSTEKEIVLDYYIRKGYYEVVAEIKGNIIFLRPKTWKNDIFVKGTEPDFKVSYKILIPNKLEVSIDKSSPGISSEIN